MRRRVRRAATLLTAASLLAVLPAGAAHAVDVTVLPGCWGGVSPSAIVCDLTVRIAAPAGVETYDTTIPICTGTCQYVPVTLARTTPGSQTDLCLLWRSTPSSPQTGVCLDEAVKKSTLDPILCPILAGAARSGIVRITAEGDVTVAGTPVWDCPLYGNLFR